MKQRLLRAVAALMAVPANLALADTIRVVGDADTNSATPTANTAAANTVYVRNLGSQTRHIFVSFDLSVLPPGTAVEQATLRYFVNAVNTDGAIAVHTVTGAWNENTLTHANMPARSALFASTNITAATARAYVTVDVTDQVQAWLDGTAPNYGLALSPIAADDVFVSIDTKEATAFSHAMELEIVPVGVPGPAGPIGQTGPAGPQGAQGVQGIQGAQGAQGVQGIQGANGISVQSTALPVGHSICPQGGASFTSASGTTYACTGAVGSTGNQGSQGPQGPQGAQGPVGDGGGRRNELPGLRWYHVLENGPPVDLWLSNHWGPAIAFDGAHIFMGTMWLDSEITKIRVSDGAVLATYFVNPMGPDGNAIRDLHYANEHIYVTDRTHLSKVRTFDGAVVAKRPIEYGAAMTDDGTHLWLMGNYGVEKIRMSDLVTVATVSDVGADEMLFDGTYIWARNMLSISKIRASDALLVGYFPVQAYQSGLAFDGTFIYHSDLNGRVVRMYASDGSPGGTLDAGVGISALAVYGSHLYIGGGSFGTTMRRVSLADLRVDGVMAEGMDVGAIEFDGANIWIDGYYTLRKRPLGQFEAPAGNTEAIFDVPGWYQYRVPYNCGDLDVKLWGAGGGGNPQLHYGDGGAGGFSSATLDVAGGEWLVIEVGAGGTSDPLFSRGGERSIVTWDAQWWPAIVAGGGGGAGGATLPNATPQLNGYAAGGAIAQYPTDFSFPANNYTGTGGQNCGFPQYAGMGNTGGQGGGGYYGGGFGCFSSGGPGGAIQQPGSGGTGFVEGYLVTTWKSGQGTFGGTYAQPPVEGTSDPDYVSGVAVGGHLGPGGPGRAVLRCSNGN